MNYYIYLDDTRTNDTWFRQHLNTEMWIPCIVRSYDACIRLLDAIAHQIKDENNSLIIDLDHDLGESEDGYNYLAHRV